MNIRYELGGNQRDTDRLRAEARHAKKGVGERKEGNPIARNERYGNAIRNWQNSDAARLAAKIAAKKAAAEAAAANGEDPNKKKKGKCVFVDYSLFLGSNSRIIRVYWCCLKYCLFQDGSPKPHKILLHFQLLRKCLLSLEFSEKDCIE